MVLPIVKRYLIALDRHKWAGLAGFAVVMGLSGVAALQPSPPSTYEADGILTYAAPPIIISATGAALQQQGQALNESILMSDTVINFAVEGLAQQGVELDPGIIRRNTSVEITTGGGEESEEPPGFSISISYRDIDERRAQVVTELLMEGMVEQSRQFNTQQLARIRENLNQLLPEVTEQLRQAERNLEQYIRLEGPAIQAAEDGNLVGAITSGQQQQRDIRLSLATLDAEIRSLESRLGLSPDQAYTSSALSADPIIADLRAQIHQNETQISILSQRLRPEHPTMQELLTQQRAYEQLLKQRVTEVIGGSGIVAPLENNSEIRQASSLDPARQALADRLVNLQMQRETLQQQLTAIATSEQELRQEYARIPNKQLEQARLQQQVALKHNFYDQLQAKLADVTLAENETVGSLIIAKNAETELASEASRNGLAILFVGGFVGLLVGGGLVLLLDSLDATFHTLQDLQAALRQQEVPMLGLLPAMPILQDDDLLPVIIEPDSPYAEPYERFRSALRRAAGNKPLKLLLLTSTVNGEGKTVTAYNLAIASARAGKRTLLIEADLRSPSQAKSLKVAPDPESFIEPLQYYGNLSDCIRLVPPIENLFILPSPGPQRHASAILESSEMRRMIDDVRGRFDLVVLDTPALSRYSDALLLEPLTDGLILVTRPGYTEEGLLNEATEQFLESDDIQFLGAVINGADMAIQPLHLMDADGLFMQDGSDDLSSSVGSDPLKPGERVEIGSRDYPL